MDLVAEVINREQLLEQVDNDVDFLNELIEMFVEDYPDAIQQLHEAVASGDAQRVWEVAHSVKGAVANFYAPIAYQVAQNLENAGREGNVSSASLLVNELERELQRVHQALVQLQNTL